jgi:hypothetical protein
MLTKIYINHISPIFLLFKILGCYRGWHRLATVRGHPGFWFGWAVSHTRGKVLRFGGPRGRIPSQRSSSSTIRRQETGHYPVGGRTCGPFLDDRVGFAWRRHHPGRSDIICSSDHAPFVLHVLLTHALFVVPHGAQPRQVPIPPS